MKRDHPEEVGQFDPVCHFDVGPQFCQYDVIGDVHGQADKLVALLYNMGYRLIDHVWRHPSRVAIFVGDLVDRGPHQLAVLRAVRAMLRVGAALMVPGNHEFNAIAYYMPDPQAAGAHLRARNEKNRHQHAAFLAAFEHDPEVHKDWIDWFMNLPLWLDLPGLRVVHACWDQRAIDGLAGRLLPGNRLSADLVEQACRKGSAMHGWLETILKGPEIDLPAGHDYLDPNGHLRHTVRIRWWDRTATSYRSAALLSAVAAAQLPDVPVPAALLVDYDERKPLIFGHYWKHGTPAVLGPYMACVDYSAGKHGDLVAYRFSGERTLCNDNFCSSAARSAAPVPFAART